MMRLYILGEMVILKDVLGYNVEMVVVQMLEFVMGVVHMAYNIIMSYLMFVFISSWLHHINSKMV